MIEHVWSVLCSQSVIDSQTNNMSLMNIVEQLNILEDVSAIDSGQLSLIPASLEIVSLWHTTEYDPVGRTEGRLEITTPDGPVGSQGFDIIFGADKRRYRTIFKMNAIPFRGLGIYHYVVSMKLHDSDVWVEVANIPLEMTMDAKPKLS
jgi:hypothetical protein